MHGEQTGQRCRQEVNGRAARPHRELGIRQVEPLRNNEPSRGSCTLMSCPFTCPDHYTLCTVTHNITRRVSATHQNRRVNDMGDWSPEADFLSRRRPRVRVPSLPPILPSSSVCSVITSQPRLLRAFL